MGPTVQRILAVDWAADKLVIAVLDADGTVREVTTPAVGANPRAVAADAAAATAYVVNHADNAFSVVDLSTGSGVPKSAPGAPSAVLAGLAGDQVCLAAWGDGKVYLHTPGTTDTVPVDVAAGPFALAAAGGAELLCVAHDKDDAAAKVLKIVKLGTADPPATVDLPGPARALAVAPSGTYGYVACRGASPAAPGTVAVVDLTRGQYSTLAVGHEPLAVAVSGAGDRICVANGGSASLSVAPLTDNHPGTFTTLPVTPQPHTVAFSPDGTLLYVLSRTTGLLTAVHLGVVGGVLSGTRTDVALGAAVPASVVFAAAGTHAYVTDQAAGRLIPVRVGPTVAQRVGTGASSRPRSVCVTPKGDWAAVADSATHRIMVSELSGDSPGEPKPIPLPGDAEKVKPWGIATSPVDTQTLACATSPETDQLFKVTPKVGRPLGGDVDVTAIALPGGASPRGVAVTPDGRYALTANSGGKSLSRVDLHGGMSTIAEDVVRCAEPVGVEIGGVDGDTLYVADYRPPGNGHVSILKRRGTEWEWAGSITAAEGILSGPHELALSPQGRFLYVASYDNGSIAVLEATDDGWVARESIKPSGLVNPYGLALSSDGRYLYAACKETNRVTQLCSEDGGLTFTHQCWLNFPRLNEDKSSASLTLSKDGTYLYASHQKQGFVHGIQVPQSSNTTLIPLRGNNPELKGSRGIVCRGDELHVVSATEHGGQRALTVLTLNPEDPFTVTEFARPTPLLDAEPCAIAAHADGPVYITNFREKTVSVRGDSVTTVALPPAEGCEPEEVACTSDGAYAYVTDRATARPVVHYLSPSALTPASLPAPAPSAGVACAPGGLRAYVAHPGDNSISILRRSAVLTGPARPAQRAASRTVAQHPNEPYAYALVTEEGAGGLQVMSLADTSAPVEVAGATVPLSGDAAAGLTMTPEGERAYAVGTGGTLWVLATDSAERPTLARTLDTGLTAVCDLAIGPGDPAHLYVVTYENGQGSLHVLELGPTREAVVARADAGIALPGAGRPHSLCVHPLGGHGFLSTADEGVYVLDLTDPARPSLGGKMAAGAGSVHFPSGSDEALLTQEGGVSGIRLGPPELLPRAWTGLAAPSRLAVSPDGREVYATAEGGDTVQVIDAGTGIVRFTLKAGQALSGLAAHPDPAKRRLYVADTAGEQFLAVDTGMHVPGAAKDVGMDVRQAVRPIPREAK
ncbi:beta-propeller fold lactonase family protein [Streptomyces inhibens]|uniref:beta-propeller fold lactonase family protein n=1 Tax=Streptomyces inhibens TaxID=2293571 RepID=UPI001EE75058|nr:beta-propeller fold lactonase family protein [Streptomyces inhibens]UKY54047.1 beta-propeller fold lactonase family protein [Streptomyces inhibens]